MKSIHTKRFAIGAPVKTQFAEMTHFYMILLTQLGYMKECNVHMLV